MRKSETRVIGDTSYTVTQLGGTVARGAAVKCGNLLGPGIKALKEGGASAAGQVLQDLTDDDLEYFCALFRPFTSVSTTKGKVLPLEPIFDEHFAGDRLGDMFLWLGFCLEINFRSFFPAISALVKKHLGAEPEAEKESAST